MIGRCTKMKMILGDRTKHFCSFGRLNFFWVPNVCYFWTISQVDSYFGISLNETHIFKRLGFKRSVKNTFWSVKKKDLLVSFTILSKKSFGVIFSRQILRGYLKNSIECGFLQIKKNVYLLDFFSLVVVHSTKELDFFFCREYVGSQRNCHEEIAAKKLPNIPSENSFYNV